jgi:cellulose synthase/poly-beta-1,6-N-acetylglucosamine synthase-like glycosyltransferase
MIGLIIVYIISLSGILLYACYQFYLSILYRISKQNKNNIEGLNEFPSVTIQLPIYNERYVIERLLKSISELDYPESKLQIQILDDSTDDTSRIIDDYLHEHLLQYDVIRRKDREGFKAGALKNGLTKSRGDFIAIFDADFTPKKDFLLKTMVHFNNHEIGVVQTRWSFTNRDYSLLTSLQAFALDTHFTIEQSGRNQQNHYINFNGTAGIWRKETILDAGNWEATTLTEDLDLSYRAQMKKWKFKYLEDVESPSELPVTISALKKQQFRWNKGGAQCFKKHFFSLLTKKGLRFSDRLHGLFHLMNSSIYVFILISLMASFPMVLVLEYYPEYHKYFYFSGVFIVANFLLMFVYWTSYKASNKLTWKSLPLFLPRFFVFLLFSFGLTIHNTLAVLEGWFGVKSPFVRTPKFNIEEEPDWKANLYLKGEFGLVEFLELIMIIYFGVAVYFDLKFNNLYLAIFHLAVSIGFLIIWSYTVLTIRKIQIAKKRRILSIKD